MKAKELIKLLKGVDPESEVYMQKDSEGNGYRSIRGVDQDEALNVDYEELVFLSHYESLQDLEDYYGDNKENLDFFSCTILY